MNGKNSPSFFNSLAFKITFLCFIGIFATTCGFAFTIFRLLAKGAEDYRWWIFYAMYIALFVAVIAFSIWYARRFILRPLSKLTDSVNLVVSGDLHTDVSSEGKDEIAVLTNTMGQLVQQNRHKNEVLKTIATGTYKTEQIVFNDSDEIGRSILSVVSHLDNFENEFNLATHEIVRGNFNYAVDTSKYHGKYRLILDKFNINLYVLSQYLYNMPTALFTVDNNLNLQFANKACSDMLNIRIDDYIGKPYYTMFHTNHYDSERDLINRVILSKEKQHGSGVLHTQGNKDIHIDFNILPLVDEKANCYGAIEIIVDNTALRKQGDLLVKESKYIELEVRQLLNNIRKMADGDFNLDLTPIPFDRDISDKAEIFITIKDNLRQTSNNLKHYVKNISDILIQISNKNLNVEISDDYHGEFIAIKDAMHVIVESLDMITASIKDSASLVTLNASNLSHNSQSLSQGVTEQAAAIEEISTTVYQVADQVKLNSTGVKEVNELANETKNYTLLCDNEMQKLGSAMEDIEQAANSISKILKMINDISFQTNILSLNAAVEAAKAGVHGKGFAVIAEDVRSLAMKSSDAANETDSMVSSILKKIKEGKERTNSTATSLMDILDVSSKVAKLTKKVANATDEQTTAVEQIKVSLGQISDVVTQTSVNAEQSARDSQQLQFQANSLMDLAKEFNNKKSIIETKKQVKQPSSVGTKNGMGPIKIDLDDFSDF